MGGRPRGRAALVLAEVNLLLCAVFVLAAGAVVRRAPEDVHTYLEDPQRVGEGQEPPHAELRPYADLAAAIRGDAETPWTQSLDGPWRLRVVDRPADVPSGFEAEAHDVSGWPTAQVPHTWQTDGLDHPMFRNIPTEMWPDDPPRVPRDVNPTGAYVRDFELPPAWHGRRTFLRFEGAISGYFVWVNGRYVGYDQGGLTPADFELTPFVRTGGNRLAVQVHRWGSGSHLEDVDQWRFSGIVRSVWLYSTPPTFLRDVAVHVDMDDAYRDATLTVEVEVAGRAGATVEASLHDPEGGKIATMRGSVELGSEPAALRLSTLVAHPLWWTDETPNLYTLVVALTAPDGSEHVTRQPVGFREIEIRDRQLLVNGRRILVKGVNRGDTDPRHGRHVPRARTLEDVRLMKRLNLNAVRTSHYPSDPYFYELADRFGLWIADEIDVETHHHDRCPNDCLAERPEWQAAFLDRFVAMVKRDRNHPSVLLWDTGNEAGLGRAHHALAEWARANDPRRPLYHQPNVPDGDAPFADVHGPRYPSPGTLELMAQRGQKPIVMGEYAHAQGNSLGNLQEFWDVVRRHPHVQGGFIWDWAEHNIEQPLRTTPDASPHAHLAWLTGRPRLVPGHRGQALFFSGLDDFVEVYADPRLDDPGRALTVDAWVRAARPWTGDFTILAKGRRQYALRMKDEATLEFSIGTGVVRAAVPTGWHEAWHRVSGTYDGTALRLWIDGVEAAQAAWAGTLERSPQPVNIARNPETMQENYRGRLAHGSVDEVRVYHRALSGAELARDPKQEAMVALDFDAVHERGRYLSYGVGLGGVDGIVGADRRLQPEAAEVAAVHAPVRFEDAGARAGRVSVTNERAFAATEDLVLRWRIEEGGDVLASGEQPLALGPGERRTLALPPAPSNPAARERWLTLEAVLGRSNPWAEAGHVVAFAQFAVGGRQTVDADAAPPRGSLSVRRKDGGVVVLGAGFEYTWDGHGTLKSMVARGVELVRRGPGLDVWRAPVSNELGAEENDWRRVGLDRLETRLEDLRVEPRAGDVRIAVSSTASAPGVTGADFRQRFEYTVTADGRMGLDHRVEPRGTTRSLLYLPRVGFSLQVSAALDRFRWYGRGPVESYADRKNGARMGVWASTVEDEYVDYHRPQDYGNHTDVRWAALTDGRSAGLLISGDIEIAVTPYDELERAAYPFARRRNAGWTTVHVAHAVSGVAETFHTVMPQYRVHPDGELAYSVTLRPLREEEIREGGRPRGAGVCRPEIRLAFDAPFVEPGATVSASLTVVNPCRARLTGISVSLDPPQGWTVAPSEVQVGTVAGGESKTVPFTLMRPATAPAGRRALQARIVGRDFASFGATASARAVPAAPRGTAAVSALEFLTQENQVGPVERDRGNGGRAAGDGGPIRMGGREYPDGLGVHAESLIEVYLGGRCTSFTADVGVDDEVADRGTVGFEVYVDGTRRFAGPTVRGADAALPASADLTGGRVLGLRVHDTGDREFSDRAVWASPRLTCTP